MRTGCEGEKDEAAPLGWPALVTAAPGPAQDAKILNFALLLECLEAEFYALAARSGA